MQHGFEAWCRGATNISDVDFKLYRQQQQKSSQPAESYTASTSTTSTSSSMSPGAIFGVTLLVVLLVGGAVVGAWAWRSRRATASSTKRAWDMATLMGPEGDDY